MNTVSGTTSSHAPFLNNTHSGETYVNVVDNNMGEELISSAPRMTDVDPHTLGHEELLCNFVDSSMFLKHGTMVVFINSNAVGHANTIGMIRIGQEDIRKVPSYLAKYRQNLRVIGAGFLMRHLFDTQCPTGAMEIMTPDDLGISFTLASLSGRGLLLNAGKRNEGPLSFAMYPGLIEPVFLRDLGQGQGAYCHIINCYLHMLPAAQRRNWVVQMAVKIENEKSLEALDLEMTVVTKKRKQQPIQQNPPAAYHGPNRPWEGPRPYVSRRQEFLETLTKDMEKQQKETDERCAELEKKLKAINLKPGYPPLPQGRGIKWPVNHVDMPDE